MNPGKKAGGALGYVFYGVAALATAGTGTFMWRHWTRLDQEPARAAEATPATTSLVAVEETELPPDHPLRLANEKVKRELDALSNFKPRVQSKDAAAAAPKAAASVGPVVPANAKGHITMIGKAGKMTSVAPATDADRATNLEEAYRPAAPVYTGAGGAGAGAGAEGPQFFTTEDKMADVRKRDAEEYERRRQSEKARDDSDPKFQSRQIYK